MKFKNWLNKTRQFDPQNMGSTRTVEFMPDGATMMGADSIRGYDQLASILRQIDHSIPNPRGGEQGEKRNPDGSISSYEFAGTVDYAAPEQFPNQPEKITSMDNFERAMVKIIPQILPDMAQEAQQLAQIWSRFRNKVVRYSVGENNYQPQARPIHFAIPLTELQKMHKVLREIGQVLRSNPNLRARPDLANDYKQLYRQHADFFHKAAPRLRRYLDQSRNNPF